MPNPLSKLFRSSEMELVNQVKDLKQKFDGLKEKAGGALKTFGKVEKDAARMMREMDSLKLLCGRIASSSIAEASVSVPFTTVEFQVFSRGGEDGIIQHLLRHIPTPKSFIEMDVADYTVSCTRFLLMKDLWRGLVIDASEENVAMIRNSDVYWRHNLTAVQAGTSNNGINDLLTSTGFGGSVGILSVKANGLEYSAWKAMTAAEPVIVICAYNKLFGPDVAVSMPADDGKTPSHRLVTGASLGALHHLADQKGYDLVGVDSAGESAFFVKRGIASPFVPRTAVEAFVPQTVFAVRDAEGNVVRQDWKKIQDHVGSENVFDVKSQSNRKLADLWRQG